jgi:hypothetical protein
MRPLAFEDLEATKAVAENSFGDEIREYISRSGLPVGHEWAEFVNDASASRQIFDLDPMVLHDLGVLEFSVAGCPVVKTGFDRVEPDGMWMIESEGSIRFFVPERMRGGTLEIAVSWPPVKNTGIWLRLNGSEEIVYSTERQDLKFVDADGYAQLPNVLTIPGPTRAWNLLEIRVENLASVGKDPRKLGVKFQRMILQHS